MIVPLFDANVGAPVYVNPDYVVSLRPDPKDPDHISVVKLRDGETVRARGDHREVAGKLMPAP